MGEALGVFARSSSLALLVESILHVLRALGSFYNLYAFFVVVESSDVYFKCLEISYYLYLYRLLAWSSPEPRVRGRVIRIACK